MFKIPEQKTAILVFAQSAEEEILHKNIGNSHALFEELNSQILREVKKTGLPFFLISEKLQKGQTFGERFANAIEYVFDKGFKKIITVGNDSPELKVSHIKIALNALNNGENVLGPSKDGGFYLMGIDKSCFEKEDFIELPWQKQSLLGSILEYFDNYDSQIFKLNCLQDIDSVLDAKALFQKFRLSISRQLWRLLNALLRYSQATTPLVPIAVKANKNRTYNLVRGSP